MSQWEQAQLDAGGFVSFKSKADPGATEEVVARRYGGAALGERVVVRLGAERLGPAEDVSMEYLGLEPQGVSKPLARQTRRALGFASWALTHHRDHAKYALQLVKRITAAARRAKAKPGHAWEEFAEMADQLNKSVRHFLPAFWEDVARIYKDLGNSTYAGRSLNKALEAERVHALDVDREHRREAVLEFTLSGCLSGKALSDYAQDLQAQFDPAEAYATLRDLAVRRTLGGMPPTANLGKDLMRTAKAAGLDADSEIRRVLEEIVASPAMSRASLQFWESVRPQVGQAAADDPTFAVWLLVHTNPQSRYSGDSTVWPWLDLLDGWNVLPWLWGESLPAEPEIPGGRTGWIGRLARVESSPHPRVFDLLERMADVLRREGRPVPLFDKPRWGMPRVDVDVLEICLDLEIPLNDVPEHLDLNFDGWLRSEVDHPRRNSPLERVARDDRFAELLRDKVPELVSFAGEAAGSHRSYGRQLPTRRPFEEAAAEKPAIHDAWWQYLDGLLDALETGGLADAERALSGLRQCVGKRTRAQFPELLSRLARIELADSLHRTVRAGVLDEYGWEVFEQAVEQHPLPLSSARRSDAANLNWVFPLVAYYANGELIVVRPDRIDAPRECTIKPEQHLQLILPVGDDVVIAYLCSNTGWQGRFVWLSEPGREYEPKDGVYHLNPTAVVPLADGDFYGSRMVKPGDGTLPPAHPFFHDGVRFWRVKERTVVFSVEEDQLPPTLVEIDPKTGKESRDSVPAWFEEPLPTGAMVQWQQSTLLPLPRGLEDPPLGSRDGLIGWRLVQRRDHRFEGHGIDGRRVSFGELPGGSRHRGLVPLAMMNQPAGDSYWVFAQGGLVVDSASGAAIANVSGSRMTYRAGQPVAIPIPFLHLMRLRDDSSSRRLRGLSRAEAENMLQSGAAENRARQEGDSGKPGGGAEAIVANLLPEAPSRLAVGLARIARLAAELQSSLDQLRTALDAGEAPGSAPRSADTEDEEPRMVASAESNRIKAGLVQLEFPLSVAGYHGGSATPDLEQHLREAALFLTGKRSGPLAPCDLPWLNLLRDVPGIAWRCFWRLGTIETQTAAIAERLRQPWLETLEFFAASGVLDLPGRLRLHLAQPPEDATTSALFFAVHRPLDSVPAWLQGENRYLALRFASYPVDYVQVLEYSPHGELKAPDRYRVERTEEIALPWKSAELRAFIEAVRGVTSLPFATPEQLDGAAGQLGVTPVEAAVVWMGDLRTVVYGKDRLTKEIRAHYGWKTQPVQEAIAALTANPVPPEVVAAPVLEHPAAALRGDTDEPFQALVAAWRKSRKNLVRLSPELIAELDKLLPRYQQGITEALIRLMSEGDGSAMLQPRRFEFRLEERGHGKGIEQHFTPDLEGYEWRLLENLASAIGLINYATPVGDTARQALPGLIDAVRRYLGQPSTLLPFGTNWAVQPTAEFSADELIARFSQHLGPLQAGADGIYRGDDGLVVAGLLPPNIQLLFRPAHLTDDAAFQRLVAVAAQTWQWEGTGECRVELALAVRTLRGNTITRIAELNASPPTEPGGWDQDARRSAAETVAAVRKRLKLDAESATYYLQLLALPDPSNANIRKWNDWTAKQIKQAAAPLLDARLVVEAKRARAGRECFLPGGWEALKAPNLPLETWKLPLYELRSDNLEAVRHRPIIVVQSVGDLFAVAWSRIESKDAPRYEAAP